MIKIQQEFVQILKDKKPHRGVDIATLKRWTDEKSSPSLKMFEMVCKANDIAPPFFFDGKVESLNTYVKEMADRMGMTVDLIFKAK